MKAILDNVLVRPCASENISEGGLFVPESFKERSAKAVIVSSEANPSFAIRSCMASTAGLAESKLTPVF
jgi:co-chaperonin GroES (HSP10)